ncbi:MAG: imidazoleglycerol-phosphate dehydratase HisB [Oscillospiraceae bacterium]|nr:imidazoleglycerol-phosphate dehydratase HisB [Oscillospiraceae bacterium]MBQ9046227.1 imidazoleglycerol-phosphate dehydratase HisB [Oscillospiraceae bacterium]
MRTATIDRKTAETEISLTLALDGTGSADVSIGVGFLDHMLTLFAAHGRFDLAVRCVGDTFVDDHHSVEDVGIALGMALREALGDKRGVRRYGQRILPMDEALILCALDLSGRCCLRYGLAIPTEKVGTFDTELVEEFFAALCREAGLTLHFKQLDGTNSHHIIEGAFKAFARALSEAVSIDPALADALPSTKGVL